MPTLPTGPVRPAIYAGQIYEVVGDGRQPGMSITPTLFPPRDHPQKFRPRALRLGDRFLIIDREELSAQFQVNPRSSGIPFTLVRYSVSVWGVVGSLIEQEIYNTCKPIESP